MRVCSFRSPPDFLPNGWALQVAECLEHDHVRDEYETTATHACARCVQGQIFCAQGEGRDPRARQRRCSPNRGSLSYEEKFIFERGTLAFTRTPRGVYANSRNALCSLTCGRDICEWSLQKKTIYEIDIYIKGHSKRKLYIL